MTLQRFAEAQEGVYDVALAELRRGRKASHWMWYVFPQVAGLGHSATAQYYGVRDLAEARDYLADPVLGPRLVRCCEVLLGLPDADPIEVFGTIDAMKLRSSMTLFEKAGGGAVFGQVLDRFFGGQRDEATLQRLGPS
ncbi:MAG TPA: DUF1810 domain-containing protein [Dermatophilaceae bacterium]|nr:DUF1810 domain-containing protein [Dermatophilaceae bacterium]